MVDPVAAPAAAPATAPAPAAAAAAPVAVKAAPVRSSLITNPAPVVDPNVPVPVPETDLSDSRISASTRAEMAAGRAAIKALSGK